MTPYAEATMHDIERAKDGLLTIEHLGDNCYRFFNYDNENPDELWENYHRTLNPGLKSEREAIDAIKEWLGVYD